MAIVTYPHGPLVRLASNLWLVSAATSQGIDRKMTVVRGAGGELFLHDALWLDAPTFAEADALGPVSTIFVPSWLHDFDGERFGERYPAARLCGMPSTLRRLRWRRLVPFEDAFAPLGLSVRRAPGLKMGETVCEVRHPEGGASLIYTDALFNVPHAGGFKGLMLRLMGSSGPLHMSLLARLFLLADRAAFRAHLQEQAARDDLRHVIVSHGEVISSGTARQLAGAAARL